MTASAPEGGGGGGGDVIGAIERGLSLSSEDLTRHSALVSAIVPDGVATVTMRFGVGGYRLDPLGHLHRRRYRTRVTVTAAIEGNILAARVPRPGFDAFPHSTMWRAADGRVIKVVHPPE